MKRFLILFLTFLLFLTGCSSPVNDNAKIKIVATNFVCYDFARAIAADKAEVTMLIPPGSDIHSFEPTARNIADIKSCDLFLYIGGESDTWVEKVLNDTDNAKIIKMIEFVSPIKTDHGNDEHIWTCPDNAIKMLTATLEGLCKIDSGNTDFYNRQATAYKDAILDAALETKKVVQNAKEKTIVVADRFPLVYFTEYFGLEYVAAFSGCEHDTDASLHTITQLIDTVKNKNLGAVYRIEMSNLSVADTVSDATGTEILELHSFQNISADDFKSGVTYIDIMKRNCEALRKGLK